MERPSQTISENRPEDGAVTVHASTDEERLEDVRLAVTIPTFKRPDQVLETLRSVVAQSTEIPFAIVVMENEAVGCEGAKSAAEYLADVPTPSCVILANRRGNCAAYNAGWWTALNRYPNLEWVLVIDDDEIARPGWIDAMLATARATHADFTGAPQIPVFEPGADLSMSDHPVFQPPYSATGSVRILYSSGNVLIRAERMHRHGYPWLDETFNFLGGGDSDFYARAKADGATFAWCVEGAQDETIPARRTELSWLNARALRNGSISALIDKRAADGPADHGKRIFKSLTLLALSGPRSLWLALRTRSVTKGLVHMNVAVGRLLMEVGFANEQYRAADRN